MELQPVPGCCFSHLQFREEEESSLQGGTGRTSRQLSTQDKDYVGRPGFGDHSGHAQVEGEDLSKSEGCGAGILDIW